MSPPGQGWGQTGGRCGDKTQLEAVGAATTSHCGVTGVFVQPHVTPTPPPSLLQVLNGLMERPDWEEALQTPLCILPGGSGNALAASINYYAG